MENVLKILDYSELARRIVQLETTPVIEGQKRTQFSYCYIYTDTIIDLKQLGNEIEKIAEEHILITKKNYILNKKRYLAISTNLLTRVYSEQNYINSTIYAGNQYNSQFRSIAYSEQHVPSTPFSITISDIKRYFLETDITKKNNKNILIVDTKKIINGEKIEELEPYNDIIDETRFIYNTKYHFDFQVDYELTKAKYSRYYSMPLKIFNDIYVLESEDKATICTICNAQLFGKYYIIKDNPVCKFCVHFSNKKIVSDDEIIFVDDNKLLPSDLGFSDIMCLSNFVRKDGYYTNDDYLLFHKHPIEYVFERETINPLINGKRKKIILVSIIEY